MSFPFIPEKLGGPEGLWVKDSSADVGGGVGGGQRPFLISTPESQGFAGPGGQTLTLTEPEAQGFAAGPVPRIASGGRRAECAMKKGVHREASNPEQRPSTLGLRGRAILGGGPAQAEP